MKRILAKITDRFNQFVIKYFISSRQIGVQYQQLQVDGWGPFAGFYYLWQCWRGHDGSKFFHDLSCVGSPTYVRFLRATHLLAHEQLALILNDHLNTSIDEHGFLQIHGTRYQLASELAPHSFFFRYFRELVIRAYPDQQGLRADQLGTKVHLFRSYLDRQVIEYLRHYHWPGEPAHPSDYERLLQYCQDHQLTLDYQTSANFHNRYHGEFTYPQNMKSQLMLDSQARRYNDARMIEFIVDIDTGQLVSEWNVYRKTATGTIDTDPAHYSIAELHEVADTESFNYGVPYGQYHVPARYRETHQQLDVQQPVNSAIRQRAKKYWRYPRDYADVVKSAQDVQAWRSILPRDRQVVYQRFVNYLQVHHVANQGIKKYLKNTNGFGA